MQFFCSILSESLVSGMIFALVIIAMRWSELITIYLAIGAPIGVRHALARAETLPFYWRGPLLTLLFWPLAATKWAGQRLHYWAASLKTVKIAVNDLPEQENLRVLRSLTALSRALQPYQTGLDLEGVWQQTRVALETYSGLTRALAESDENKGAAPREAELWRLAGYDESDLICAGHCINRRNAKRLIVHQKQARQDFLATWQIWQQATADIMQSLSCNKSEADYVGEHWHEFAECVRRLCVLLKDAAAVPEATRWEAGKALATEIFPVAPSLEKNLPPQMEVRQCTPMKDLPFSSLPNKISRLG